MDPALERLKQHLAPLADLRRVLLVLQWDQETMMPPAGAAARANQLATVSRLLHERFTSDETGRLLDEVRPLEESLDYDSDEAALIRVTRHDYEKEVRVPASLRSEMTRAGAEGREVWKEAKARSDFASFLPALERNVELKLRYIDCFDHAGEPYDVLLDDFERGMTTAEVRAVFDRLKEEQIPLIADAALDDPALERILRGDFPQESQRAIAHEVVELFGYRPGSWRLDPTEHPFASGGGIDDIRITTNYHEDELDSLFSTMHEFGHGLYEHQVDPSLERSPLGSGVSLGGRQSLALHESQSRMWENLVGRSLPFWRFFYPRVQETFRPQLGSVELDTFYRAINRVRPSLIRIRADEATYNLHIILRFELEQDIVNGRVEIRDLATIWDERMEQYLGVTVPDDAHGVLQDVHWGAGHIGYFSTYALGNVISLQIWERVLADAPDLYDQFERGEFVTLREWLGEHLHRHGRKFGPKETLERVVGGPIDPAPYLRYLREKFGVGAAV